MQFFIYSLLGYITALNRHWMLHAFFFTMADDSTPPLKQPKTLSQLILGPWFVTVHLIQYLTLIPNALDSEAALTELWTRDFASTFQYLLSLGYSHWHRRFLMTCLIARLDQLPVNVLQREIAPLLPTLSALWYDPLTQQWFPIMGPLTQSETVAWDINAWFYGLLHKKQMAGQFCRLFDHFLYSVSILTYANLELHFS